MSAFRIGPFELVGQLGRGGMGSVWTGRHVEQGVPVAVKVLYARYARNPWFRSSFAAEVRAVARLDHPNIVPVRAILKDSRYCYIVMDCYSEGDLFDFVTSNNLTEH